MPIHKLLTRTVSLAFLVVFLSTMVSCRPDEIITNPGNDLKFSSDTLSFDTVFSTVGSTTAWMTVRNLSDKTIRIASISLQSGGESGFHINLNGITQTSFTNVEIPAHDSLFLFVEVKTNKQGTTTPNKVQDAILFDTDGPRKQIILQAWSWDAVFFKGKVIRSDSTLTSTLPIVVYDSLVVAPNTTLTIEPGTQLFFHDKAMMKVYGTLSAIGTKEAPIQMRGDRQDYVLKNLPYDRFPGQWYFLQFTSTSFNNRLEYLDIHGAYYGIVADSSSLSQSKLKMFNSVIHNMVNSCLLSFVSNVEFGNCQLTNSGQYTVGVVGGNALFTHCTIANYMGLINRGEDPALILVNYQIDARFKSVIHSFPLTATFNNCIIFGNHGNEVGYIKDELTDWNLHYQNCLFPTSTKPTVLTNASDCLYAAEAKFLNLNSDGESYRYDFRLDSISPARRMGSTAFLGSYSTDLNGVSRTIEDKPDVGAYEWVQGQK
ncbi:MAG TPA: choice-of-anchor Q domain-containing protein [Bacteroidales bacterium]|nr:choice-of-anchor Q domain-containing protein [Bacteroidales bacterium]